VHRLLVLLIAGAVVTFVLCAFYPLLEKQQQARSEIEQLQVQVDAERRMLARQNQEISSLKGDPEYLETIIRERFDLMRRGETIIRFDSPKGEPPRK
jgi:cell division protein FtsB